MADELTVTASITYEKNNHQLSFTPDQQSITVAGEQHSAGVQGIPDSAHEALVLNEVGAAAQGWAWFRNIGTDTATQIDIGAEVSSSFVPIFSMKGGEFALMRLQDTALYAKASSGAGTLYLQYSILEA